MSESNGHEEAVADEPPLVAEITAQIEAVRAGEYAGTQRAEVAMSFLCEARGRARRGQTELAERKVKAAHCVLTGEYKDE